MLMHIIRTSIFSLALGATAAIAGTILASAPIPMTSGNIAQCLVANVGPKDLADVTVSVVRTGFPTPEVSVPCDALAPNGQCGFQSVVSGGGARFCVITLKGSTKALRGDFCDITIARCTPIR
jgi:hypothetical protein